MFKTIEFIFNINEKENEYLSLKYIDVTNDFINQNDFKNHDVLDAKYFKTNNGTKYIVDGKNVVLDYSKEEKDVAIWLAKTFGGKIYMLPRVNNPDGIQTADYLFKNQYWDLKLIKGTGKNSLDNAIKNKKNQSSNFIYDISESNLNIYEIIIQIQKIYNNPKRVWVNTIIVKNKDKVVKIFKKNEATPAQNVPGQLQ